MNSRSSRRAAVLVLPGVVVTVVLLAAGCSSGGAAGSQVASVFSSATAAGPAPGASTAAPASAAQAGAAAAACLRAHGIGVSDPALPIQRGHGIWNPPLDSFPPAQLQAAQTACQAKIRAFLLIAPKNVPWGTTSASKVKFAACMRSHGVAGWPDPVAGSNDFPLRAAGIDPDSPAVQTAEQACAVKH
jgi:hypothetical protein